MHKEFESDIPKPLANKINLLLNERQSLLTNQMNFEESSKLISRHKRALLQQTSKQGNEVEYLLDNEKCVLADVIDQKTLRDQSPNIRFSQISQISFQDQRTFENNKSYQDQNYKSYQDQNYKSYQDQNSHKQYRSNKTIRSISTAATQQNISSVQCKSFEAVEPFKLNPCRCEQFDQFRELVSDKMAKVSAKMIQQEELLSQENHSLRIELERVHSDKRQFEEQVQQFKSNLSVKLQEYAFKLDEFNRREILIVEVERENIRLKQEREEMKILMQQLMNRR